jgi:hypothetical protein
MWSESLAAMYLIPSFLHLNPDFREDLGSQTRGSEPASPEYSVICPLAEDDVACIFADPQRPSAISKLVDQRSLEDTPITHDIAGISPTPMRTSPRPDWCHVRPASTITWSCAPDAPSIRRSAARREVGEHESNRSYSRHDLTRSTNVLDPGSGAMSIYSRYDCAI